MPYKNPKDRKKQKNEPVGSKTFEARMERQRARRRWIRQVKTLTRTVKPTRREGKDVSHKKALSRVGLTKTVYSRKSRRTAHVNYKKKK